MFLQTDQPIRLQYSHQIKLLSDIYSFLKFIVDGKFTTWTSWDTCTLTCGTGSQGRTRSCTNPSPQYGGASCVGVTSQNQNCNTHHCPS